MSGLREEILAKYQEQGRLLGVLLEVTHRCHCSCDHCLIAADEGPELSTDEIRDLLEQIRREGAWSLGITGGEPFMREDLPEILAQARQEGFFVSLLTTGIAVDTTAADMLKDCGVQSVEISMLGATAETHDAIMNHPGAFERMIRAAKLLRERGIMVILKTTLMRDNFRELPAMAELAAALGTRHLANVSLTPRTDGDLAPQDLGLSEEELAGIDPGLVRGGLVPNEDFSNGALLTCRAGLTVAGISPQGDVYPCVVFRRRVGNIRERSLREIWRNDPDPFLKQLRALQEEDFKECFACDLRLHCRRCPGVAFMETGALTTISPSACKCARGLQKAAERFPPA